MRQTLKIAAVPVANIRRSWLWCRWATSGGGSELHLDLPTLGMFAPHLGQTSRDSLSHIHMPASEEEEQEQNVSYFTSQVLSLQHLWDLCLESPSFRNGRLDPMLRCPQTPWETFSITNGRLMDSDLTYLFQCPNLSQLKTWI